jgi:hypothetical protein
MPVIGTNESRVRISCDSRLTEDDFAMFHGQSPSPRLLS